MMADIAIILLIGAPVALLLIYLPAKEGHAGISETVVYLRENRGVHCRHWEQRVYYDAWGSPYVKKGSYNEAALFENGKTSDTHLRGTEWRHKSGPPVTFGKVPTRPFEDTPPQPSSPISGT